MTHRAAEAEILDVAGFVTAKWCTGLIEAFRAAAASSSYQVRRLPRRTEIGGTALLNVGPAQLADELGSVRARVRAALGDFCALTAEELHVEYTLFTQMEVGDAHPAHADAETPATNEHWVPNHTFWRHSVGLLYLNTSGVDYAGGDLVFPALQHRIAPRAGRLVGFPSGHQHWHEVTPIMRGCRCSLAIWTTLDPAYEESWDAPCRS